MQNIIYLLYTSISYTLSCNVLTHGLGSYPYPSLTNIEVVDALLKGFRMECPEDYVCPPEL